MIEFRQVHRHFANKKVLNGVSFSLSPNQITYILGKSGMGKSVLLRHLVGLMRPDSGEVWVDGERIDSLSESELTAVRRKCGMVFQHPALLDGLTVGENIGFGMRAESVSPEITPAALHELVQEKMGLVGLRASLEGKFPREISYGEQKLVSIARVLAIRPRYLLFDEPTTSLDPQSAAAIDRLIQFLARELKVGMVVVSHDMDSALAVADRILLLDSGSIVADGSPQEILQSKVPLAVAFFSETRSDN